MEQIFIVIARSLSDVAISALISVILRSKATKDLDYVVPPWFDELTTSGTTFLAFCF